MKTTVLIDNLATHIANAFQIQNIQFCTDSSTGAVKTKEAEGWYNIFYQMTPSNGVVQWFVKDYQQGFRVAYETCRILAIARCGASFEYGFPLFRECFVWRFNCYGDNNAVKPWITSLAMDFDTRKDCAAVIRPLDRESIEELVSEIARHVEGYDITSTPWVAVGNKEPWEGKRVSMHLYFPNIYIIHAMPKAVAHAINASEIAIALGVECDHSIYNSGLKFASCDKPVNGGWRGKGHQLIAYSGISQEHMSVDVWWTACFPIRYFGRVEEHSNCVEWHVPIEQQREQRRRIDRGTIQVVDGAQWIDRVTTICPQFAGLQWRCNGNFHTPIGTTFCPYKNNHHRKPKFACCVSHGGSVTLLCFSAGCHGKDNYPIRLVAPSMPQSEIEEKALATFQDFVKVFQGQQVQKFLITRVPTSFDDRFTHVLESDFCKFYRYENIKTTSARGKTSVTYLTKEWLNHRDAKRAERGWVINPLLPTGYLANERQVNLWRGFRPEVVQGAIAYEGNPKDGCALYLRHIRHNLCQNDEAIYDWLLNWCAYVLVNVSKKPGVALTLKGLGGEGKTVFCEYLERIVGQYHYYKSSEHGLLAGTFNSEARRARLLVLDEQAGATSNHRDQARQNDAITSRTMEIEEKFMPRTIEQSYMCIIQITNHVFAGRRQERERRWVALTVQYDVQVCGPDKFRFFRQVEHERENGGAAAFYRLMLDRDISEFNAERDAPKTVSGWWDVLHSLQPIQQWWYHVLREGALHHDAPNAHVTDEGEVYDYGHVFGKSCPKREFHLSCQRSVPNVKSSEVWQTIKRGWNTKGYVRTRDPWHRHGEMIDVPTLDECRAKFQDLVKQETVIWDCALNF